MARRRTTPQSGLFGNVGRGGSSSAVTSPLRLFEDITEINQENVFISQTQRLRNPSMLIQPFSHAHFASITSVIFVSKKAYLIHLLFTISTFNVCKKVSQEMCRPGCETPQPFNNASLFNTAGCYGTSGILHALGCLAVIHCIIVIVIVAHLPFVCSWVGNWLHHYKRQLWELGIQMATG